jgi:hypothetical protein
MKNRLISFLLVLVGTAGLSGQAYAGPIVLNGSSYSVHVEGDQSGNAVDLIGAFDGAPTNFTRAGLNLALTESETDLGNGQSRIIIKLASNGELFPVLGEAALFGVGSDGDVLNVLPVSLDKAFARLYDVAGELLFDFGDVLPILGAPSFPWHGAFPSTGNTLAIDVGGIGVAGFEFEFLVTDRDAQSIPEPGSLMLGAIALLALVSARSGRRRGWSSVAL